MKRGLYKALALLVIFAMGLAALATAEEPIELELLDGIEVDLVEDMTFDLDGLTLEDVTLDMLEAPQVEAPAEEQPAEDQPAEEQPIEEQPVEEQPAEEQPAEEKPVEEQPAEEQPAEEQPAEEQLVEEQPTEDQPTEEQPAEEQPVEEQPVEEQPVEGAPVPNELVYTGEALALVSAGEGWLFSTDGETYSEDIPTAVDAGEYTVYFKPAEAPEAEPQSLTVTVAKADVVLIPPQVMTGEA